MDYRETNKILLFISRYKDLITIIISSIGLYISIKLAKRSIESDERTTELFLKGKEEERIKNMPIVFLNFDEGKKYNLTSETQFVKNKGFFGKIPFAIENSGNSIAKNINIQINVFDGGKNPLCPDLYKEMDWFEKIKINESYNYSVPVAISSEKLLDGKTYRETYLLTYYDTNLKINHHLLAPNEKITWNNASIDKVMNFWVNNLLSHEVILSDNFSVDNLEKMKFEVRIKYSDIFGNEYKTCQVIELDLNMKMYTIEGSDKTERELEFRFRCIQSSIE